MSHWGREREMTYFIGEAVKLTEKVFAHVLEIAFVMSFVLIVIMAVRFAVRKGSKSLSYGLWGAAGIGVLYAALPFLRRPLSGMMENIKAAGNIGSSIRGSGFFSKLTGLAYMRLGAHAENVQAVGNAASETDLAAAATLSDAPGSIFQAAKSVAAGGGAGLQKLAGAGANSMQNADGGAASDQLCQIYCDRRTADGFGTEERTELSGAALCAFPLLR